MEAHAALLIILDDSGCSADTGGNTIAIERKLNGGKFWQSSLNHQ